MRVGNSGGRGRTVGVATVMRAYSTVQFRSRRAPSVVSVGKGNATGTGTRSGAGGKGGRNLIPICHLQPSPTDRLPRTWVLPKRTGSNKPLRQRPHPPQPPQPPTTASMTTSWTTSSARWTRETRPFSESLRQYWRKYKQSSRLPAQLLLIKQAAAGVGVGSGQDRCARPTTPALRG